MKWSGQHIFDLKSKFRNDVDITGDVTITGTLDVSGISTSATHFVLGDDDKIKFGTGDDGEIYVNGDDLYIKNVTSDKDIIFSINDGGTPAEIMRIDGSTSRVGIGVTAPASKLHVAGTVQVGVDDTGHDVKFFGATSGKYMVWDQANDGLVIQTNPGSLGLSVFTAGSSTAPNFKVGRYNTEYWGVSVEDRTAHLIHRQDESTGSPKTSFEIWDSNTTDSAAYWIWNWANGSGGSMVEKMRLTKAGVLSVAELDISGNIDIDGITNLDAVDIDGAVQIDNTLTVGVNDTGHDVLFYGATSNKYLQWDESEDHLLFSDNTHLIFGYGSDGAIFSNSDNLVIQSTTADKDIILKADDGSGGVTAYLTLDGSAGTIVMNKPFNSTYLGVGTNGVTQWGASRGILTWGSGYASIYASSGNDLWIGAGGGSDKSIVLDGSTIEITTPTNFGVDDTGHDVKFFGDTAGKYMLWDTSTDDLLLMDGTYAKYGTSSDLTIGHTGSESIIDHGGTGNLVIRQSTADSDIVFESDDGSGGETTYFSIDGGDHLNVFYKNTWYRDNVKILVGNGNDLQIYHDTNNTYIKQTGTGNLYIQQTTNDADIVFSCDDGNGGTATYFTLDGSAATHDGSATTALYTTFPDKSKIGLGDANDLQIYHSGSHSYINDTGTGDLILRTSQLRVQTPGATSMLLATDGGATTLYHNGSAKIATTSGGVNVTGELEADSLDIDGVADISGAVTLGTPLATDQQRHLAHFTFKGYGTSDGTNYEMGEIMTDYNAPFEHNTSTGSDGLTANEPRVFLKTGGHVMPRAGVLMGWVGWSASAGSGTVDVGLFKVTPTRNSTTNLTPVLLKNTQFTALGNTKLEDFNETEFGITFARGDIIYSAVKGGTDAKAWYIDSTLEVEWT